MKNLCASLGRTDVRAMRADTRLGNLICVVSVMTVDLSSLMPGRGGYSVCMCVDSLFDIISELYTIG